MRTPLYRPVCLLLLLGVWSLHSVSLYGQRDRRTSRFFIRQEVSAVDTVLSVKLTDNQLLVSNAPSGSTMQIYTIVGTKVKEVLLKQSSGSYAVSLPRGYYIVRIGDVVRKIVVR